MFFNRCAALRSAILFLGSCLGSRLHPGRGRSELEQTRHNLQDPGLSATARGQLFKGKNVNKIKAINHLQKNTSCFLYIKQQNVFIGKMFSNYIISHKNKFSVLFIIFSFQITPT